jgi:hypothetical protein
MNNDNLTATEAATQYAAQGASKRNIRTACTRGYIAGAWKAGKTWVFTRQSFEAWLKDAALHKRGRKERDKEQDNGSC